VLTPYLQNSVHYALFDKLLFFHDIHKCINIPQLMYTLTLNVVKLFEQQVLKSYYGCVLVSYNALLNV